MAGARDARAAELLDEADPARAARGCGCALPPAARRSLRLLRTLGGGLSRAPLAIATKRCFVTKKLTLLLISVLLLVGIASCQNGKNSSVESGQSLDPTDLTVTRISNIQVKTVDPSISEGKIEEFPLPNCGGTGPLKQSLGTQVSVTKQIVIGGKAKGSAGGEVEIPETMRLQLELAIEASYQQMYERANARLDTIMMEAAPESHVVYKIQWERQEFSSVATFENDGELFETPYTFVLNTPKVVDSVKESCPDIGEVSAPTPVSPTQASAEQSPSGETSLEGDGPFRPHYQVVVGDGIFSQGTFSDGMAPYSEQWLWDNNHFKIQRIRQEEYPSGCDVSRYNANLIWIAGTTGMQISINDEIVGTYKIADYPHGYIFEWPINIGDKVCAVGFRSVGFMIIIGPDIYYHYDSYCYRGACQ